MNDSLFCTSLTGVLVSGTNVVASQEVRCAEVILNGVALSTLLAAASTPAATAGDVLKTGRILINNAANFNMTNNWYTVFSHTHTPSDASSYINVTFTGMWQLRISGGGSQNGEWRISLFVDGTSIGDSFMSNSGMTPIGESGPCFGQYLNSSLASKTISLRAIQTNNYGQSQFYLNYGHNLNSNWLHIEEVKR